MNYLLSISWTITLALTFLIASSQTVIITDDPDYKEGVSSAVLDLNSQQAGFLMPRMTKSQREAILEPAKGLILFQTDAESGFYYNAGSPEDPMWVILSYITGTMEEVSCGGMLWDVDGNRYPTVHIGDDLWMAENLRVTNFRNGEPIPAMQSASAWTGTNLPAYSVYDNMPGHITTFGLLYNGYVIQHPSGICPEGWMVPEESHWYALADQVGGTETSGQKLKAARYWDVITPNALNSSGFSALPSGYRSAGDGVFLSVRSSGGWWAGSDNTRSALSAFMLHASNDELTSQSVELNEGFAIRCVKIRQ